MPSSADASRTLFADVETVGRVLGCVACSALAAALAAAHPLWPEALGALIVLWAAVAYWVPSAWLVVVPAALPALNASPWTGWIGVEEFDLLLLTTIAAGHARLALDPRGRPPPLSRTARLGLAAVLATTLAALWRGISDAPSGPWSLFEGYESALNSVRVAKSGVYAIALWPLWRAACYVDAERAFRRFALGMVVGAVVVVGAVLRERAAYPGLFDLGMPYRTSAMFWEMHVGGAAIDAYVVMATPFVVWALWTARSRAAWAGAALLAIAWAYVVLTTYSRGAYLGAAIALVILGLRMPLASGQRWRITARFTALLSGATLLLGVVLDAWGQIAAGAAAIALAAALWLRWRRRAARRQRSLAAALLTLALLFEVVLVFGPESMMSRRAAASANDYQSRTAHWGRGLALLQEPGDWLLGLGLGRLPAHYDRFAPGGEFPGRVALVTDGDARFVRIAGPRSNRALGITHGLTQRVPLHPRYRVAFKARAARPAHVLLRVCESHLLYVGTCQWAGVLLDGKYPHAWRSHDVRLRGPALSRGSVVAPRGAVLTISVINAGGAAELDDVVLEASGDLQVVDNGDFSAGLAHWLPAAQSYFVPWHIDNLYLELLIERGLVGAVVALLLLTTALAATARAALNGSGAQATILGASLAGVLVVGLVSSILDMPRATLLLGLLLAMSIDMRPRACAECSAAFEPPESA